MALSSSGAYLFQPSIAEFVRTAYARIQLFGPMLSSVHLADARMATNLLLTDWAANRGVDLGHVDQIQIPLVPGTSTYVLPANTIDLLDVYLRTMSASATTTNLGNALTVLGPPGNPMIGTPYGDPILIDPGLGSLSCTAGSPKITLKWPQHQLLAGMPIFWGCPVSIGGLNISGMSVVDNVIDGNTLQFTAPTPALESQQNQGATPLFSTNIGSGTVDCIMPSHGLAVGSAFSVPIALTVGGLTLSGSYTVAAVINDYEFNFTPGVAASSIASLFENGGQVSVAPQATGVQFTDVPLFPLSRNDYAALSVKSTPGRPTSFWLDRIVPPTLTTFPVAPANSTYAIAAWRMREFQDAHMTMAESLDMRRAMWPAFVAGLTAHLAEIYKPEQWAAKVQAAEAAWLRAAASDKERVTTHIVPQLQGYFR